MRRRSHKPRWIPFAIPAAGALLLAGSALGTPSKVNRTIASFFPSLAASASAHAPANSGKALPAPRVRGNDAVASFRVGAHSERAEKAAPPRAQAPHANAPTACGKHFLSPFEGGLSFRSAYRSGGGPVNYCPQWSTFGPVRGGHRNHWGVDISSPTGTSVRAGTDGVVSYAREPGGYGLYARLRFTASVRGKSGSCNVHPEEIEIIYAHLIDDGKTSTQTRTVRAGEVIGRVGCTGNAKGMCSPSPESHLHVTVQKTKNRAKLDPGTFLGWSIHTPAEHPADWGVCGRK